MTNAQPLSVIPSPSLDATVSIIFKPIGDTQMLKAKMDKILELRDTVMVKGIHYGPPFKDSKKDVLLKAGSELLSSYFGLYPRYLERSTTEDWSKGLFHYRYECQLIDIFTGMIVGSGIGSCNSMEAKYRWRDAKPKCPTCEAEAIMTSRFPDKKTGKIGFYCNAKAGGCGASFDPDDKRITQQEVGRIENNDPYTLVNTLDKQAQKRAFVAAVFNATGASAYFTQDVEDFKGHKYFGDPNVIEGDYEEIKSPTTTTETSAGTPPPAPTTGSVQPKTPAEMMGKEAAAMLGNGNRNGRRIGNPPPAQRTPQAPSQPEEPPLPENVEPEETPLTWDADPAVDAKTGLTKAEAVVSVIRSQTGDTTLTWEQIKALVPAAPSTHTGQEFIRLAVTAWQATQKPAGTRLGQPGAKTQDAIVDTVRYIQAGNSRYLEFAKGPLFIRRYDRSGAFRKDVGEEYYSENGFEQMVPMTRGDEPYNVNPLQVFYEAKDGYLIATRCVPVTDDKVLDQYFGDIPFPEAG